MDQYTLKTKEWLDERFSSISEDGIYLSHQNIYGFGSPHIADGVVLKYAIVYNILKELSRIEFSSFLDVGGAEGYMAALVRKLFGTEVRSCDLSRQACLRAREIFGVAADPVNGVALPYPDGSFDVVLSSETLEHIPDSFSALKEILRVAKKAAVITVPFEHPEIIGENIRRKVSRGHIHSFTPRSFRDIAPPWRVAVARQLYSSLLRMPFRFTEGRLLPSAARNGFKRALIPLLNSMVSASRRIFHNEKCLKALLAVNPWFSGFLKSGRQLIFVLVKDPSSVSGIPRKKIAADDMLRFKVPPHFLPKNRFSVY